MQNTIKQRFDLQYMAHNISTTYRSKKQVTRELEGSSHTLAILMSMLRVWLEYAWSMPRVCLRYAYATPTSSRLTLDELTARPSRDYGSSLTRLRLVISLLLMLIVGSSNVWGQTHPYAGVWFMKVKKNLNYYMVPAADPQVTTANHVNEDAYFSSNYSTQAGDPEKPFITTYHTSGDLNSIWIFVPVSNDDNYYYIVHAKTGKYIKYQTYLTGDNARRKYVHLETMVTPGETEKFEITELNEGVRIKPKNNAMYFNVAGDNQNRYNGGTSNLYYSGMVGGMSGTDTNSQFNLTDASSLTLLTPEISDVNETDNTFTITSPAAAFSTIRYTTDGSTTPDASTGTSATSGSPITITGNWSVQAVGVFDTFVTPVAGPKELAPAGCAKPVITYDYTTSKVSISCTTPNSTIYYTTDGSTPISSSTPYSAPFSVDGPTTVKAIATHATLPSYINILISRLTAYKTVVSRIGDSNIILEHQSPKMMICIYSLVLILIGNTSSDDMARNNLNLTYHSGVQFHTKATSLETCSVSGSCKGSRTIAVIECHTILYNDGCKTVDEVKAIITIPPSPTTSEHVSCIFSRSEMSTKAIYITAISTFGNRIVVVI